MNQDIKKMDKLILFVGLGNIGLAYGSKAFKSWP